MSERLHKVLAQHGIGSRREVERWIIEGRLQINGVTAKTGDRYEVGDRVQLDGRDVGKRLDHVMSAQVLAYHKPQGQPIARPAAGRQASEHPPETIEESVEERLPVQRGSRWVAINPMHPGDSGLLLFTNDGALSYALTRQKKKIPTTYMVRVHVRGGVAAAPVLPTVLRLDDETIDFTEVSVSSGPEGENESGNIWYKVEMPRADKRAAVRALFASHELIISRMMQVAFGPITLTKEMPRARSLQLTVTQREQLYALAQMKMPVNPALRAAGMKRSGGHGSRNERDAEGAAPTLTAQEARAATRVRRPAKSLTASVLEAPRSRAPQQRAELRRAKGGGSNRASRPAPARPKR
jgi:23S rRNA pseudouridine2605 synthase